MSDIDKQLNNFITRWCGENAAHLLDNDENDGQRLRDYIAQQVKEAKRDFISDICDTEATREAEGKDCISWEAFERIRELAK